MPPIHQSSKPELYEYVKDRNLQGQWFLLETLAHHALQSKRYRFIPESLFALHHSTANLLDPRPGQIRNNHVYIAGSDHIPPHETEINKFLSEFFTFLNGNFNELPITEIGAYALWHLTWIHPFHECNGRTARAFSYLVMCKKMNRWAAGPQTLHQLIRENDAGYYQGLQLADKSYKETGEINVSFLADYLKRLLYLQLSSSEKSKHEFESSTQATLQVK